MVTGQPAFESEGELQCVVADLKKYFLTCPQAADTLRGIKLWLARQRLALSDERVLQALERLIREGLVTRRVSREGPDQDVFFRR